MADPSLYIAVTAVSHDGLLRDHNEDSLLVGPWTTCAVSTQSPQTLVFPLGDAPLVVAVADGLGGHPGGDVASPPWSPRPECPIGPALDDEDIVRAPVPGATTRPERRRAKLHRHGDDGGRRRRHGPARCWCSTWATAGSSPPLPTAAATSIGPARLGERRRQPAAFEPSPTLAGHPAPSAAARTCDRSTHTSPATRSTRACATSRARTASRTWSTTLPSPPCWPSTPARKRSTSSGRPRWTRAAPTTSPSPSSSSSPPPDVDPRLSGVQPRPSGVDPRVSTPGGLSTPSGFDAGNPRLNGQAQVKIRCT